MTEDETEALRQDNLRLRRALQHVEAMGRLGKLVAGQPLQEYARAALRGDTE